jgi:hypothetical protein
MTPDVGLALLHDVGNDAGFSVEPTRAGLARVTSHGFTRTARIRAAAVPPNPARVGRELSEVGEAEALLYVVPRLTASLRQIALADARLIVAAVDEGRVVVDRHEWNEGEIEPPPRVPRGRKPWGRLAVARALLRTSRPRSQAELATESGITQQAVAAAVRTLAPLGVTRAARGWTAGDPGLLWDSFLTEYPGPGGLRRRWVAAADLVSQVSRAREAGRRAGVETLVSGDVAADEQGPLRRPLTAVLYSSTDLDLSARSVPVVGDDDWTVSVVLPEDPTVFATARAWRPGADRASVTDPVMTAWEVSRSRGAERDEAVAGLKRRVLLEREGG